jgi:hypothetical protein
MSLDDQNNYGASIGFKDDALGTTYQAASSGLRKLLITL